MIKENIDDEMLDLARDYSDNQQYVNAIFAIGRIETDRGGMDINTIWEETETLRRHMLKTDRRKRPLLVDALYNYEMKAHKDDSENVVRSVMCIMMMFALRLVTANRDQSQNPNRDIIRNIVRILCYKAKEDERLMTDMKELLRTIDEDGDYNDEHGAPVEMNVDILADNSEWQEQIAIEIHKYIKKADAEWLIRSEMSEAFDSVWATLVKDSQFAEEMRTSNLGKDYNLVLVFNVFGLLYPDFYNTKVKGAQSIARVVGENPNARGKNKFYSKDYFNINEIGKLNGSSSSAFRSQQFLNHVKGIINKSKAAKQ